jgi:hypothetical protein
MRRATMVLASLLTGAVLAVSGPAVAPALAAGNPVVSDCFSHGKLTKTYTKAELSHALTVMSSYIKQYSDCQSVVQNALASGEVTANGGGGTTGGGGSSISTPVIIVIVVVVVLAIVAFAGLLIRRRRRLPARGSADDAPTQVIEPDRPTTDDRDGDGDGGPAP